MPIILNLYGKIYKFKKSISLWFKNKINYEIKEIIKFNAVINSINLC